MSTTYEKDGAERVDTVELGGVRFVRADIVRELVQAVRNLNGQRGPAAVVLAWDRIWDAVDALEAADAQNTED